MAEIWPKLDALYPVQASKSPLRAHSVDLWSSAGLWPALLSLQEAGKRCVQNPPQRVLSSMRAVPVQLQKETWTKLLIAADMLAGL